MEGKKQLAIVIPAYKKTFFRDALLSIASQTNKNFTLYIGDDKSPDDLYSVVKEFESTIDIVYQRFDENMGGKDLVAQWERCIQLTQDEKWLWLFSDDDLMEENCVEVFYHHLPQYTTEDLFHFDVKIIDENNQLAGKHQPFPAVLSPEDFFSKRIRYELSSFVVEFIFSRQTYMQWGGFQKFDLAWGSDDATWIKFSADKGITTLPGASIKWRFSGINISSKIEDKGTLLRKMKASEAYIAWATTFLQEKGKADRTTHFEKMKWILAQFIQSRALTVKEKWQYIKELLERLHYQDLKVKMRIYLAYMETKKRWQVKKSNN